MKKKPDLSIIIVNYKVYDQTINCIKSIIETLKKVAYEIIIVDNEDSKKLKDDLRKFRNVLYLSPGINLGYGAGNNFGVEYASGKYLFFLNPDTVIKENSMNILYEFIKNKRNIGAVAPLLLNDKNEIYPLQGSRLLTLKRSLFSLTFLNKIFKNNKISRDYWYKNWNKKEEKEVDVVPGTAFMISKQLFLKLKGFDPGFFLYFEEFDLCKRIKKLGYKNFILPHAKINHKWGASTKFKKDKDIIFKKSRFYYFKKNYGITSALINEFFSRFTINSFLLLLLSIFSISIVMYKIQNSMIFIGDQAWYYIAAKDMLKNYSFPLVGITSSHTWLHQGPMWTYLLAPFLYFFNFSPLAGIYLSLIINIITIYAIYFFTRQIFNKKTAIISSILYSTSPLIIFFTRMPFQTNPIPLFTILFMYALYNWFNGKKQYFPLIFLYIGILYNFELATVSLFFIFLIYLMYGFVKKTSWAMQIINKKTILLSLILFLIPMFPVIYYDLLNGFPQTFKFSLWIGYKAISVFIPSIVGNVSVDPINANQVTGYFLNMLQHLIFPLSIQIAIIIVFIAIMSLLTHGKRYKKQVILMVLWLLIVVFGILSTKTLSEAYLPVIYPALIIITAFFYGSIYSIAKLRLLTVLMLIVVVGLNIKYTLESSIFNSNDLAKRTKIVNEIIKDSKGNKFNLIGEGEGSQFRSFTMPYEYLLSLYNSPVSEENEELKYYIRETNDKIKLRK